MFTFMWLNNVMYNTFWKCSRITLYFKIVHDSTMDQAWCFHTYFHTYILSWICCIIFYEGADIESCTNARARVPVHKCVLACTSLDAQACMYELVHFCPILLLPLHKFSHIRNRYFYGIYAWKHQVWSIVPVGLAARSWSDSMHGRMFSSVS